MAYIASSRLILKHSSFLLLQHEIWKMINLPANFFTILSFT